MRASGGEEVIHLPVGVDAGVAQQRCELRVVAHGVQQGVEQDHPATGDESPCFGGELDLGVPFVGVVFEQVAELGEGQVVGVEDVVDGGFGYVFVLGDGFAVEALGVAELGGDDVLQQVGDGGTAADVAAQRECVGILAEPRTACHFRICIGVVPVQHFFRGIETGHRTLFIGFAVRIWFLGLSWIRCALNGTNTVCLCGGFYTHRGWTVLTSNSQRSTLRTTVAETAAAGRRGRLRWWSGS